MDMMKFSEKVPSEQLAIIFKDFFNEHIAAGYALTGIDIGDINVITDNKTSIMYSVKMLPQDNKDKLVQHLQNLHISVYGQMYVPQVYIEGDLLCITFKK
mgnify:CR=1 FL=1